MKARSIIHLDGNTYRGPFVEMTNDDLENTVNVLKQSNLTNIVLDKETKDGCWIFTGDALSRAVIEIDILGISMGLNDKQ